MSDAAPAQTRPSADEQIDKAWRRLELAAKAGRDARLADLVDEERVQRMTLEAAGLYIDLSKQAWTDEGFMAGIRLARACDVEGAREAMFAGERINTTENRAVEHAAVRARDASEAVLAGRERMRQFVEQVRSGEVAAADGERFRAILHIGIGGSDLGPRLLWAALRPDRPRLEVRFTHNVDPAAFEEAVRGLDPKKTLVIAVSKTFGTLETLANLGLAKAWLETALGDDAGRHMAAVSSAPERCLQWGIGEDRVFPMMESVGGRYSVWSAVSLSCAIGLGWRIFNQFLGGGSAMDHHFRRSSPTRNAPVLMALAEVYNRNGLGRGARAVVPYAHRLSLLGDYLQQLEMESNGKQVKLDGAPVGRAAAPVVFGQAGTLGQHAFFQLLHQGTDVVPVDFVIPLDRGAGVVANGIAQAEALLLGQESGDPHRAFPGNRPSTTILMPAIDPKSFGALLALYEHKTFVEGVLWGINSFDQWGVELGKTLAARILPELEGRDDPGSHDASTAALIARAKGAGEAAA
ncbi:MAG TPA: glucose-6-phosphate isomerase [Caulobacteraceae bacterium]|nr:glucose-6-phosphate isomerase [Caulobacteraceae bacterium]